MPVTRRKILLGALALTGSAIVVKYSFHGVQKFANANSALYFAAPEFVETSEDSWLNSKPLRMADLKGKVVMLEFWTFDCWNCYRSFPWLSAMEQRLKGEEFIIIGIHTPEFKHEKVRANVEKKIAEFGLLHPTVMDNNFEYWRTINNRYWPSYYLVDKKGFVRHNFIGETHEQTRKALEIESSIRKLLNESV